MTAEPCDLYAVLGLSPEATQEQIRRAYRVLVRQNHPDTRSAGDPDDEAVATTILQQAMAAYTILGDPAQRAGYDRRTVPQPVASPRRTRPVRRPVDADPPQPTIRVGPVYWRPSR
ncbi:J domain-containing protein [Fodinibacter luteus]